MDQNFTTDEVNRETKFAVFAVIHNKAFRSLWFGQICSQLAVSMILFVLALRIYELTKSSTAVSGLYLTFGIPAFVFGLVAGAIVDHFDKRMILMFCDLFRAILAVGLLFLSSNVAVVYVMALIYAIVTQFYVPAEAPSIPRLVPSSQLVTANSLFSFTFYTTLALGGVLAGPVLLLLGPNLVFLLIGILFLIAFYNAYHVPAEVGKREIPTLEQLMAVKYVVYQIINSMREGVAYVRRSAVLLDSLLLLTGTQVILGLLGTLGPGFADKLLNIDVRTSSVVIVGPVVLGIILGALWVGNVGFKYGPKKLIKVGIISAGIFLILISVSVRLRFYIGQISLSGNSIVLPLELILFFLLGVANSFLDVPANSILQKEAKGDMRSRVYGVLTAAVGGLGILPTVVSGVLADTIGVGKVIFILGLSITGYGIYRLRTKVG